VSLPWLLVAVNVMGYVPAVPLTGVPLSTCVLALNVTPFGRAPLSLNVGAGFPVAVTVNVPVWPTANAVLLALVITGAWAAVTVNGWVKSCAELPSVTRTVWEPTDAPPGTAN
jgi:hypothetical protein